MAARPFRIVVRRVGDDGIRRVVRHMEYATEEAANAAFETLELRDREHKELRAPMFVLDDRLDANINEYVDAYLDREQERMIEEGW